MIVRKVGPDEYLIYGRRRVDLKKLKELVKGVGTLDLDAETRNDLKETEDANDTLHSKDEFKEA